MRDTSHAPTSILRSIAALRGFFKWLFVTEIIENDPTNCIEPLRVSKNLPKVLTINEIESIFKNKFNFLNSAIIELLYAGGLRVSELADLKISNLNIKAKYVRCIGKGSKERIVPIIGINANIDEVIDSSDASKVLMVYALISTGKDAELTIDEKNAADVNKDEACNFHPFELNNVTVYEEAKTTIICRKIYADDIKPELFLDNDIEKCYPDHSYHKMYICEVVAIYQNE